MVTAKAAAPGHRSSCRAQGAGNEPIVGSTCPNRSAKLPGGLGRPSEAGMGHRRPRGGSEDRTEGGGRSW